MFEHNIYICLDTYIIGFNKPLSINKTQGGPQFQNKLGLHLGGSTSQGNPSLNVKNYSRTMIGLLHLYGAALSPV